MPSSSSPGVVALPRADGRRPLLSPFVLRRGGLSIGGLLLSIVATDDPDVVVDRRRRGATVVRPLFDRSSSLLEDGPVSPAYAPSIASAPSDVSFELPPVLSFTPPVLAAAAVAVSSSLGRGATCRRQLHRDPRVWNRYRPGPTTTMTLFLATTRRRMIGP